MRALLIFNPTAGRARRDRLERAARVLAAAGWRIEHAETDAAAGARASAQYGLKQGHDVLVACGGDGTLAQIASEVASVRRQGKQPLLATLPFGTANVFARDLGLPLATEAAAQSLVTARARSVPLGRARFGDGRERDFLCFASCGFDARVIHRIARAAKRRFGVAAFVAEALRQLPVYRFPPLAVTVDGAAASLPATLALVTLTRHYAGPFALFPAALAGRPYLLLGRGRAPSLTLQLLMFLASAVRHAPGMSLQPVESARIAGAAPVQLDGEAEGCGPVAIEICPAALSVLAVGPER